MPNVPPDRPRPNPTDSLPDLVAAIDAAVEAREGAELLRVSGNPPTVARRPLDGQHPLDSLLGFTAPADWTALGLHCPGRARRLDAKENGQVLDIQFTFLLDRDGDGAGVMRTGERVIPLPGPPQGFVGDACRRALDLPTAPPPSSTVELWLLIWLDRLVDSVAFLGSADRFSSWPSVVALHPAETSSAHSLTGGPVALADATRQLAQAWPWARLRGEPDVADTAGPGLSVEVAGWMDDGMFARWVLSELPNLIDLESAVEDLLPAPIRRGVAETVMASGLAWAPS